MQLKIISLNLAGFKDWGLREQPIVDFIANEQPDVVLLQEVKFDLLQSVYSQSVDVNRLLPRPFPFTQTTISKFYQSSSGDTYREGLAVLSRLPITQSETLVLNKQLDDKHPRIVQNIDIEADGKSIFLSNIHLSNNKYSVEQLKELLSILKARGERRIIAGDFNIFDLEESKDLYTDEYTSSIAFKNYVSFPSEGHTLDYALLPKSVAFRSLEVHEKLSDHCALVFEIEISEE